MLLIPGLHPQVPTEMSFLGRPLPPQCGFVEELKQHIYVSQSLNVCSAKLQLNLCKKLGTLCKGVDEIVSPSSHHTGSNFRYSVLCSFWKDFIIEKSRGCFFSDYFYCVDICLLSYRWSNQSSSPKWVIYSDSSA